MEPEGQEGARWLQEKRRADRGQKASSTPPGRVRRAAGPPVEPPEERSSNMWIIYLYQFKKKKRYITHPDTCFFFFHGLCGGITEMILENIIKDELKGKGRSERSCPLSQLPPGGAARLTELEQRFSAFGARVCGPMPANLLFRNFKIIYRRYAGLYFCICVDVNDNNLAYLEAIHNFVEVLNEYFHNVCELDLVFNFYKVYTVVDEMFLAGEIRETSQTKVLKQLLMLQSLE
ncbi:AP-2 complex subunit sigma isoform X1 [Dasypus novemcinctus]|uniref:AP-2 complex subunit sigma isoform X1 n=1 Tax=Dasypus novemcinctus TaxID=9361 RepID=UPI00265E4451|nr:AP-2 complex subunit sigma isoform X1 [Dasypus novemcinctus]